MRITTKGFVGRRLTQARKARGLTAVTLADILGVSSTTISQYEHDKQAPHPEKMAALARALNQPENFFLRALRTPKERMILYRSLSVATKAARERAESRYDWLREVVSYFSEYFDFPAVNLPVLQLPDNFRDITTAQIEAAAQECRKLWGIGESPIPNLVLLLENNGVIVSRWPLGAETLDAFSEWLERDHPYIILGSDKNTASRSRFDASHELGHLVLHRKVNKKDIGLAKDFRLLEKQAHRFAAAFLLPRGQFVKELWAPTLDAFVSLKGRWNVSVKGMIVRSHSLGLMSDTQYQRMMINYNRRWKDGEPLDDQIEPETPRFLSRCVEMLLSEKIKTREEILADLCLSAHDIEELTGLANGYLSQSLAEVVQLPVPKVRTHQTISGETGNVVPFSPKR